MLKRKIYDSLLDWKQNKSTECLIIKGARQVGKTFIVRQFGKSEYKNFIEINFHKNPEYKTIFEGEKTYEEIIKRLTAFIPNITVVAGSTILFLDEIQKCASARTALKFLAEDGRIDVIATGSLLGVAYGSDADSEVEQVESIPVGYEKQIIMYPLDYEEFLWANGFGKEAVNLLLEYYNSNQKVPHEIHNKYERLLNEYVVVGGMPEVVNDFINNHDFGRVQGIQDKIINSYIDDISHHAKGAEKTKVRRCYDSIPGQLARENKKFKYSTVESGSTARKYSDSIQWLIDANLANACYNVYEPALPLRFNEKSNEFKLYINDIGLLLAMFGFETKQALLSGTLKGFAKGGIYENLVAETLVKNGYSLHYYKPNDSMELEFLIEKDSSVIPIEVKAGNSATKSLNGYIDMFAPIYAYKIISGNIGLTDNKKTIPHYMAMFI